MIKKIIAYQRLLLSSISLGKSGKADSYFIFSLIIIAVFFNFMEITLFFGNSVSSSSILPIMLPVISVWFAELIINKGEKTFEMAPVSRKFVVFNIFIFSILITLIEYIVLIIIAIVLIGAISLIFTVSFDMFSPEPVIQAIDTAKGDTFMLIILVIILFVGTMIVFIKNKKIRLSCFVGFYVVGYGLLFLLKTKMPIAPSSDKVEFLESFSIMTEANTILISVSIATVLICIGCVFFVHRLYIDKQRVKRI